jgi:stage V sporulation protein D (sporulation-specific penicillin-binding protein)
MKHWRANTILLVFCLIGAAMIGRLFYLQIIQGDYWKALARGQQTFHSETWAPRGEIYLSDNEGNLHPLAINRSWEFAYVDPREIHRKEENIEEISEKISEILNLDQEWVLSRISRKESMYEKIKDRLTPQEIDSLRESLIPGLYIKEEDIRYYPQNKLAAHVVGFVGGQGDGQYGIEGYYNDVLKGEKALQEGETSPRGNFIKRALNMPQKSDDIVLTIDYNIQFMAEKILKESQESLDFEGATIIVGDPYTGRILALVNWPDFDPNSYSQEKDFRAFKNSAVQAVFEPGSIFKPFTLAIALEEGKITPQTKYQDQGFVQIGGYTLRNYAQRVWGQQTMTEVLEKSINTGAVYAQKLVSNDVFMEYFEKLELFQPTGIELQGEAFSQNLSFKEGYEVNFANASYGQGIALNSMQIFKAFSALANGGRIHDPFIVEREQLISEGRKVFSPLTSSQITSMMISVTENGFAKTARVPGYYVAGKTGTAQVSWSSLGINKRGYSDKTIQSFIGYAPAFDPAFVILVKLDNPKARTAEYSAAPIFSNLAKYILDYYQIMPERE